MHGGAGLAVQHAIDVAVGDELAVGREQRAIDDLAVGQCREGRRNALAFGLVAGGAVLVVGGLAGGHQLVLGPGLVAAGGCGSHFCFLLVDPGGVFGFGYGPHHHRHEAVILAAQFGALAAIDAGLLDAHPGFAQEAGNRVALDAKLRHPPCVDHVGGGEQDAHLLADRQHHFVIHFEQVVLALGLGALDLCAGGGQGADELDAGIRVFVLPFPLQAGDLQHHVGPGAGVFHVDHRVEGRDAHQHEVDEKQNGEGHQHPEPLERVSGAAEAGGLGADALAVLEHRINHDCKHHHEQHGDDDHELVVHRQRVAADGCDGLGEVPGVISEGRTRGKGEAQPCKKPIEAAGAGVECRQGSSSYLRGKIGFRCEAGCSGWIAG